VAGPLPAGADRALLRRLLGHHADSHPGARNAAHELHPVPVRGPAAVAGLRRHGEPADRDALHSRTRHRAHRTPGADLLRQGCGQRLPDDALELRPRPRPGTRHGAAGVLGLAGAALDSGSPDRPGGRPRHGARCPARLLPGCRPRGRDRPPALAVDGANRLRRIDPFGVAPTASAWLWMAGVAGIALILGYALLGATRSEVRDSLL